MAVGLGRRAIADDGAAGDHGRLVGGLGALDRRGDGVAVEAVDMLGVPARGLEARHLVDRGGEIGVAVDGDAVVVPEDDQLVQLQMAGEVDRLVADALHEAAVARDHIGVVIDDLFAELGGEHALGQREADRHREALAERAGRRLDARRVEVLGMARGLRVKLAELLQFVHRHDAGAEQLEHRIEQHRAVAGREDEAVAVRPMRIGDVEFQEAVEEHRRDIGHAHRHARMAGLGLLDGVHGKRTDGVGHARFDVRISHGSLFAPEGGGTAQPVGAPRGPRPIEGFGTDPAPCNPLRQITGQGVESITPTPCRGAPNRASAAVLFAGIEPLTVASRGA